MSIFVSSRRRWAHVDKTRRQRIPAYLFCSTRVPGSICTQQAQRPDHFFFQVESSQRSEFLNTLCSFQDIKWFNSTVDTMLFVLISVLLTTFVVTGTTATPIVDRDYTQNGDNDYNYLQFNTPLLFNTSLQTLVSI